MEKRDEKKRFEYVLGVLCREPSFFPADSLEGHFTRKKSEEIGKNAENRRKMQTRKGAYPLQGHQEDRPPGCRFNVKV